MDRQTYSSTSYSTGSAVPAANLSAAEQKLLLEKNALLSNPTYTSQPALAEDTDKKTKHSGIAAKITGAIDKLTHHGHQDSSMTGNQQLSNSGTATMNPSFQQASVLTSSNLAQQDVLVRDAGMKQSVTEIKRTPITTTQTKVVPEHLIAVQSERVIPAQAIQVQSERIIPEKQIAVQSERIIPEQRIPITETKIIPEKHIPITEMATVPEKRIDIEKRKDLQEITTTTTSQRTIVECDTTLKGASLQGMTVRESFVQGAPLQQGSTFQQSSSLQSAPLLQGSTLQGSGFQQSSSLQQSNLDQSNKASSTLGNLEAKAANMLHLNKSQQQPVQNDKPLDCKDPNFQDPNAINALPGSNLPNNYPNLPGSSYRY